MDIAELKREVTKLPESLQSRPLWLGVVETLERLDQKTPTSDQELATLRQEVDTLTKRSPAHPAGLCSDAACHPCRTAEVAVAQQTKDEVILLFEEAATTYGLRPELSLLAEAVKRHRMGDTAWRPGDEEVSSRAREIEVTR